MNHRRENVIYVGIIKNTMVKLESYLKINNWRQQHKGLYMLVQDVVKKRVNGNYFNDGIVCGCPNCRIMEESLGRIKKHNLPNVKV